MEEQEQEEFEDLLEIDRFRLDDETAAQPRKVWTYAKMLAVAQLRLDEAKSYIKDVEADVDSLVRIAPKKFGLDKLSEVAIKKAILRSNKMQRAIKRLNKAQYRVSLLEGANKALDHRRTSITILNNQDERGYYSRPKEPNKKEKTSRHRQPLKKKRNARNTND